MGDQSSHLDNNHQPQTKPYYNFMDRIHPKGYRQEEIEKLQHAIRAKENRLVIGIPEIGLSNLLRYLVMREDWPDHKVTFAYIDCGALRGCRDLDAFYTAVACQFFEQGLCDRLNEKVVGYDRLRDVVERTVCDPSIRLVVTVVKTDKMLAQADDLFYEDLKALTDNNKCLCYIFAVGHQTAGGVDPEGLLFAGRELYVATFNDRDFAGAVKEEGDRLGVEFSVKEQHCLFELTGGHPGLLRAITSAVVEEAIEIASIETAVTQLISRGDVSARCRRIWQALDSTTQATLRTIIQKDLASIDPDSIDHVRKIGLIRDTPERLTLFSPVFEKFILGPGKPTSTPALSIAGGKVFKGKEEIKLRPQEFKLLSFLMTEPGKVHSHDAIAWNVWDTDPGNVSPEMITGVVSQIRARLGKKYIKTHWGRGYEFVQEH